MALLDLEKIIIKRTILGIRCTSCGGNLIISNKKSFTAQWIRWISLGAMKPEHYECEQCKKRYLLL